jgi:hypothetical protein
MVIYGCEESISCGGARAIIYKSLLELRFDADG